MNTHVRLGLAIVAVAMHLCAPMVAFAHATLPMLPGDVCSASRDATRAPADRSPMPASDDHHCAHAPCCAGAATDAAAPPPPAPAVFRIARTHVRAPALHQASAAPVVIAAAQPRGPPLSA
jgi:hypothetical protein